jgi:large conductance mechanosensitive channel
MLGEFKKFALRGNVIDLAVGIIIGAAFGKIITSFVEDVITPLILKPALDAAHLNHLQDLTILGTVKYGLFLSAILSFLVVAFILFLVVKAINATARKDTKPGEPPPPAADVQLLTEIRDILKNR